MCCSCVITSSYTPIVYPNRKVAKLHNTVYNSPYLDLQENCTHLGIDDVEPNCTHKTKTKTLYKLVGILVHDGCTIDSGHYICHINTGTFSFLFSFEIHCPGSNCFISTSYAAVRSGEFDSLLSRKTTTIDELKQFLFSNDYTGSVPKNKVCVEPYHRR